MERVELWKEKQENCFIDDYRADNSTMSKDKIEMEILLECLYIKRDIYNISCLRSIDLFATNLFSD